jgi:sulfate transport system ATP-binding protein
MLMTLQISNIEKRYGRFPAVKSVSLIAAEGEFLALLGPSGSGKTTLLRILAGLESADDGQVTFCGEDLLATPARHRGIGFVFQHYALFRHMNVEDNITFGMRAKPRGSRPSPRRIQAKVSELLSLVQLEGLGARFPSQLSGGQRQRVALARALAIEPKILLLDEPFGALDAKVRRELRGWLKAMHQATGLTTIFVTHDQEEALTLADRVAVLNDGVLEQVGSGEELCRAPESAFVADFLSDAIERGAIDVQPAVLAGGHGPIVGAYRTDGRAQAYVHP